jgi:hypothetical protein
MKVFFIFEIKKDSEIYKNLCRCNFSVIDRTSVSKILLQYQPTSQFHRIKKSIFPATG